jgi:hypothetical protein
MTCLLEEVSKMKDLFVNHILKSLNFPMGPTLKAPSQIFFWSLFLVGLLSSLSLRLKHSQATS